MVEVVRVRALATRVCNVHALHPNIVSLSIPSLVILFFVSLQGGVSGANVQGYRRRPSLSLAQHAKRKYQALHARRAYSGQLFSLVHTLGYLHGYGYGGIVNYLCSRDL